jgi:hypothetical protein
MEAEMEIVMDVDQGMLKSYHERMEAYHQRTNAHQKEKWAEIKTSRKMGAIKEKMQATITTIRYELEDYLNSGGRRQGVCRPGPQ